MNTMNDQLGKSLQHSVNQKFGSGTYQVLQPIKRGADGYVYKIEYIKQKRLAALKVLPRQKLSLELDSNCVQSKKKYKSDNTLQQKAENQIKIHQQLRSNYIVKLYNSSKDDMNYYIFLDYIAKGDLGDQISKYQEGFHINRVRKIGLQLAKGIDTIHKKFIVHRDIKPQNILLTDEDQIKICDFSCAKVFNGNQEKLGGAVGTLDYVAPQIVGKYDNNVDIWSYGCVLFAMVTSHPPFKLDKSQRLNQLLPKTSQSKLKQLLRKTSQSKLIQFNTNLLKYLLQCSSKQNHKQTYKFSTKCTCKNNQHIDCYKKLTDLLKKIFTNNVQKRIKISQIIQHKFFTGQQMQFQQQNKKLKTIQDYQANTKRQTYSSTGIIKNYNRTTTRQSHRLTQQNLSSKLQKQIKDIQQKQIRPKTSYSLQNIKKPINTSVHQQKQQKKMIKTQTIINNHKQKYKYNGNKTNIAAYINNRYNQQKQNIKDKDKQQRYNNQNINILNIDMYRRQKDKEKYHKNTKQQTYPIKNAQQLFQYKLKDKYTTNNGTTTNNQNRSSIQYKYISDGKQIKQSHNQSQNSSNVNSLNYVPEALNTQGINYKLHYPEKQQLIMINQQGIKGEFMRSKKVMLISPKGRHITLSFQGKIKRYELERLPEKYMALYQSYREIVNGLRKKSRSVAINSRQKQLKQQPKESPQQPQSTQNSNKKYASQIHTLELQPKADISLKIQLTHSPSPNSTKYQYKPTQLAMQKKQYILSLTKKPKTTHQTNSQPSQILVNLLQNTLQSRDDKPLIISQNKINIQQIRTIFLQLIQKVMLSGIKDRSQRQKNIGVIMQINYQSIQIYTQMIYKYCDWLLHMPELRSKQNLAQKLMQTKYNTITNKQTYTNSNSNSNKNSLTNLLTIQNTTCTTLGDKNNKNQMIRRQKQKERQNFKHYDHRILLDNYNTGTRYR